MGPEASSACPATRTVPVGIALQLLFLFTDLATTTKIPIHDYLCANLPGLANFPIDRIVELTPSVWLARN
jgi:hypothetical protein